MVTPLKQYILVLVLLVGVKYICICIFLKRTSTKANLNSQYLNLLDFRYNTDPRANDGEEAFTLWIIFGYSFTLNYQATRFDLLYGEI